MNHPLASIFGCVTTFGLQIVRYPLAVDRPRASGPQPSTERRFAHFWTIAPEKCSLPGLNPLGVGRAGRKYFVRAGNDERRLATNVILYAMAPRQFDRI
jgi:hypothetical protein